jgi:hypothetical protein
MKVKVSLTKTLDDSWATEEELKELSDEEILELIQEDVISFVENAEWKIERT